MTYKIVYSPTFRRNLADQAEYFREQQVPNEIAERWFDKLTELIYKLSRFPRRYVVDQSMTRKLGREVRKFVYARRVISFRVDDKRGVVDILTMIHGAMRLSL